VEGVYSADPRVVERPRLLASIDPDIMLTLAYGGSKVIHPRAVEFALKYGIPVEVKSSFSFQPGTMLKKNTETNMELRVINAIAHKEDLLRYLLPGSEVLTSLLKSWSFEIFRYYLEAERFELTVEAKYENEIDYLLGSHGISPLSKETGIGFVIPVGVGINLDPGFLARILEICAGMELIRVNPRSAVSK
jgi:aspartate kinase